MRVKSGVSLQRRKEQRTPKDKKERTKTIIINNKKNHYEKVSYFLRSTRVHDDANSINFRQ